MKMGCSDTMLLDDVAADFPGLPIIMAEPSVPCANTEAAVPNFLKRLLTCSFARRADRM